MLLTPIVKSTNQNSPPITRHMEVSNPLLSNKNSNNNFICTQQYYNIFD